MWRDIVDGWLSGLGLPASLDEAGAIGLVLTSGATLTVQVDETGLLRLFMDLLRLPADGARVAVLEAALASNLAGGETGGASAGLDTARDTLVLTLVRDLDGFAPEEFGPLLAAFADTGQDARHRLSGLRAAAAPAGLRADRIDPSLLA